MLNLHVLQAENGDCLILEFGTTDTPKYILIDGGPQTIYDHYLKRQLQKIKNNGAKLELVIVSHVDNDHIIGLLDMMKELDVHQTNSLEKTISIDAIWHNSFSRTLGDGTNIETRLRKLFSTTDDFSYVLSKPSKATRGIREGDHLTRYALKLNIPLNSQFKRGLISVDEAPQAITMENLSLRIVGPTKKSLEELKKKWIEWLDKHEPKTRDLRKIYPMSDRSVPNLSSIMILVEADGKKILLTGDARGDHLIQGLRQANLLNPNGTLHVDILKVPHHGSCRNVDEEFFKMITADTYVISANGKDGNPDLETLIWIVKGAKEQHRNIKILVTNQTSSTEKLLEEYLPDEYGYKLTVMEKEIPSLVI